MNTHLRSSETGVEKADRGTAHIGSVAGFLVKVSLEANPEWFLVSMQSQDSCLMTYISSFIDWKHWDQQEETAKNTASQIVKPQVYILSCPLRSAEKSRSVPINY